MIVDVITTSEIEVIGGERDQITGLSKPTGTTRSRSKISVYYNARVFRVVLISAVVIVLARFVAPQEIGKDQGLQLQAAQRLVDGLGLTITHTTLHSNDISEPSTPLYLTWWPPAFSLIVAGFLGTGLSLLLSLKILYALVTLIGWTGWAILASRILTMPLVVGRREYPIHLLLSGIIPILNTPRWDGTDIFLWAGVPFVAILLFSAKARRALAFSAAAGLLFGLLYSIRYASLFLAVSALFIIAQVSLPDIKSFLKRAVLFSISAAFLIFPTAAYIKLFSNNSYVPVYVNLSQKIDVSTILNNILQALVFSSDMLFGHALVNRIVYYEIGSRILTIITGVVCLLAIALLPYVVYRNRSRRYEKAQQDLTLTVSLLPISLAVFFSASTFALGWSPFAIERYYEPILLCSVLVCYELVTSRPAGRLMRAGASLIVLSFVIYSCIYVPIQAVIPGKRRAVVRSVLSYTQSNSEPKPSTSFNLTYPQFTLYSRKENSRRKVKELHELYPEALFFVMENYQYYVYDDFNGTGPDPGVTFRYFPPRPVWSQAYTSKPIKVFWVLDYPSVSSGAGNIDFVPPSNLERVYLDEFEKTLIVKSDFPAGYRFSSQ